MKKFILAGLIMAGTVMADDVFKDDFTEKAWSSWKNKSAVGSFSHNKEVGNAAPGSLEIKIAAESPKEGNFTFTRRFKIVPGNTYTARVFVHGEDLPADAVVSVNFRAQDAGIKFLPIKTRTKALPGKDVPEDNWRQMELTFRVPADGEWSKAAYLMCLLGVRNTTGGRVFFDDFEFFRSCR